MRTIFAEYNPGRNSIDVYTSADYMLRIDCWEAEKNLVFLLFTYHIPCFIINFFIIDNVLQICLVL